MLTRNIVPQVLLATLVAFVFVLVFSTPKIVEAGAIYQTVGTEYWSCIRGGSSETCMSQSRTYVDAYEPWYHWINPFEHPHSTATFAGPDRHTGSVVTYCFECDPPSW